MTTPAAPNLTSLEQETREFSLTLKETAELLASVKEIIGYIKQAMEIPGQIAKAAEELHKIAQAGGHTAEVFAKIGFLKPVANAFGDVVFVVDERVIEIGLKARDIDEKFKPYIEQLERAEERLERYEEKLKTAAENAENLADRMEDAGEKLDMMQDFIDNPDNEQVAGIDVPGIDALKDRMQQAINFLNTSAGFADTALGTVNDQIDGIRSAIDSLSIDIDFDLLRDFADLLTGVRDEFDFLSGPLTAVYDAVGPVLDAMDSIFGWVLAPLESVLESVVEATGIQDLIDEVGQQIVGLLPDLSILDVFDTNFDAQFTASWTTPWENLISNPLQGVLDGFEQPDFLDDILGPVSEQDDVFLGNFLSEGGETVAPSDGDDVIIGSAHGDSLQGGAGADLFIGGGGDDTIDGGLPETTGDRSSTERDTVVYQGSVDDYAIVSIIGDDGFATGTWIISDLRRTSDENDGTDILTGIEDVVFADFILPIADIDSFVRTNSADGERRFVEVGNSNVSVVIRFENGVEDTFTEETYPLVATPGVDWVYGNVGFDDIFTGAGNDQLTSFTNGPLTIERYGAGDVLNGGGDDDIFFIGSGNARWDIIEGGSGEDLVVYNESTESVLAYLANGGDYDIFRPTSVVPHVDLVGFANTLVDPQPDAPSVRSVIRGVEHIGGTRFDDGFWGSSAPNRIDGGEGDDSLRGLDGDDTLIGGPGSDTLIGDRGDDILLGGSGNNQFVGGWGNDTIVGDPVLSDEVLYSTEEGSSDYTVAVDFVDFTSTGFASTGFDMPVGVVILPTGNFGEQQVSEYGSGIIIGDRIGQDLLQDIDVILGSIGDDIITAAFDAGQNLYGGRGDDYLEGSTAGTASRLAGGLGDDTLVSHSGAQDSLFGGAGSDLVSLSGDQGVAGDLIFGDNNRVDPLDGTDVFDMSDSNYSWHLYIRAGAGVGTLVSNFPISIADADDPKFVQPVLFVDGVTTSSAVSPGVNQDLRVSDANALEPGGRANGFGEFEVYLGSQHRDIMTVGSTDGAVEAHGNGGDDVIFGNQQFGDTLTGGAGNDVLGTMNQSYSSDPDASNFDASIVTILDGGEGDDTFVAGDAREDIRGGAGIDVLTYEASGAARGTEGVIVDLGAPVMSGGFADGDLVSGIENLIGSYHDDSLSGDEGRNLILGWYGDDTIAGEGGADALYGGAGDDVLMGGDGDDFLHGGLGADELIGGAGRDVVSYALYQEDPKGGADRLTGATGGIRADLMNPTVGEDTLTGIEDIVGSVGDDTLAGDDLGNVIVGNEGHDTILGRGGTDILSGGLGDDEIYGGDGQDWLSGGAGTNTIYGGDGVDYLEYSGLTYGIVVQMPGAGDQTGQTQGRVDSVSESRLAVWTDSVEMVADPFAPGEMVLTGDTSLRSTDIRNSDGVLVQGEDVTPERLFVIYNPTFARDPADVEPIGTLPEDGNLPDHLDYQLITQYDAAVDFFEGIEAVAGGDGDDSFLGNGEDNIFFGNEGADTLRGGGGIDTAGYSGSDAGVQVDLQAGTATGGHATGDLLDSIENLIGSDHGDVLIGDQGANLIDGAGGSDTIQGGGGQDTVSFEDVALADVVVARTTTGLRIVVQDGGVIFSDDHVRDDVEVFRFADGDYTFDEVAGQVIGGDENDNTLVGTPIADVIEGYEGNDDISGGGGADDLRGGTENDTLRGEGGDDTLRGGSGADLLIGGEGHDALSGGSDTDAFEGGPGDDTYFVNETTETTLELPNEGDDTVASTVDYALGANVENLILAGRASLGTGNGLDNMLTGNAHVNTLTGLGGNDTLDGGGGADRLVGGAGDDTYILRNTGETIVDTSGRDTVVTEVAFALDGQIENLVLAGTASVAATGNSEDNEITGNSGDNLLLGLDGDDTVVTSGGNDTADGGNGSDVLRVLADFGDTTIDANSPDFIRITTAEGTTEAYGFERIVFDDQAFDTPDLRDAVITPADAQLYAGSFFENDFGIDMSREGGGTQFLNVGPASQGSQRGNQFHFATEFDDGDGDGGRAFFGGSGFLNLATGVASSFQVDFTGGNTTQMSVFSFSVPLIEMLDADWDFWQTNVFSGDDRITGSYFDDTLVGFRGDDTIFGGLGDKEHYDVADPPNTRPSTIRTPGDTSDPQYWVEDGNDLIRGEEGNDLIDGGTGNDTLFGGIGNDQLWGGAGQDEIFGDAGDDTLSGGAGDDALYGGTGANAFLLTMGMGDDTVFGYVEGQDSIDMSELTTTQQDAVTESTNADGHRVLTLSDGSTLTLNTDAVNSAPVGSPVITGTPRQGEVLSADSSGLSDPDGIGAISWVWTRDGVPIPGATSASYVPTQDDVGHVIGLTASYTDDGGTSETVAAAATTPIENANDPALGTVSIVGQASVGRTLRVETSLLEDADGVGVLSWQWLRDGTPVTGADDPEYTLLEDDIGGRITARVTWTDGFGTHEMLTSTATSAVSSGPVSGTPEADTLPGSDGNDEVNGLGGNDVLAGRGGDDTLNGGDGADTLTGNSGSDSLNGGGDDDLIEGGIGFDTASGGAGNDTLNGNDGYDRLDGGEGDDELVGNNGFDTLLGGDGNDTLFGGLGTDSLLGEGGDDLLGGQSGMDFLSGGDGRDTLNGNAGADLLQGDADADLLNGGINFDTLEGGAGSDTLNGGNGADLLLGGADGDRLEGNAGADTLNGGTGNDTLRGGIGADVFVFDSGSGEDRIVDLSNVDRITLDAGLLAPGADLIDYLANDPSVEGFVELAFGTDILTVFGYSTFAAVADNVDIL